VRTQRDLILIELLVLRSRRGEPEAARELVRMFEAPLVYYVRRLMASEADAWDVVQDTWLNVFRTLRHLKEPRSFTAYLYTAARNNALAHLRRNNTRDALHASIDPPIAIDENDDLDFTPEDAAALHQGLGQLSLAHREVLTLFFLEELSVDEIARVVGVPPGTVKSRLHHAKRALRDVLEKGFPE
jgi:RNA polymerase sigma-70 factor (ECF subfamily)